MTTIEKHINIYIDKIERGIQTKYLAKKYECHRNWIIKLSKRVGFLILTDEQYKSEYKRIKTAHSSI